MRELNDILKEISENPIWDDNQRRLLIARIASRIQTKTREEETFQLAGKIYNLALRSEQYLQDQKENILNGVE